jgi:hypothetical protein
MDLQQKQEEPKHPDADADAQGKRRRVRQRLHCVARDVGDLNLLLKNLSEGKNVPMALLVQDKRLSSEADVSDADEEVRALATFANQPHVCPGAAHCFIGQRCFNAASCARTRRGKHRPAVLDTVVA